MNRLVVVSNRVPLPSAGAQAGGLSVALHGLMGRRGGLWFGWSGRISETAETAEPERETAGGVDYVTFDLTATEHHGYYNKFSNGVLWPLLHTLPELMEYDRGDAVTYRQVNERIAALLAKSLRATDLVWIHDYHLFPLAASLRSRHVHNPIGFFLHVPFAPADVLGAVPEMASFIRDLLSADLIGFQTDNDLKNFAAAAQTFAGALRLSGNTLQFGSRRVKLGVFPVEIDANEFAGVASAMVGGQAATELRASLGERALILGIDRLDPTKGLLQRIAGIRLLFERYPEVRRHAVALQVAASSRSDVQSYRELRTEIDREVGSLNGDLGDADWTPLRLVTRGIPREVCAAYMRIARVCLLTPLRDGMNLVAKEFVAAQDPDDPGVLVLSRFAGAARQLDSAVLVNPHDSDAVAEAIEFGLRMPLAERQARWQAMWAQLADRTPIQWGRNFVSTLVRISATGGLGEREQTSAEKAARPPNAGGFGDKMTPDRLPVIGHAPEEIDPALLLRGHRLN